jgi:hypothetical protein
MAVAVIGSVVCIALSLKVPPPLFGNQIEMVENNLTHLPPQRWRRIVRSHEVGHSTRICTYERVQQLESGKTGEIAIGAGQCGPMLDGERSQMCVHDERPLSLSLRHHVAEDNRWKGPSICSISSQTLS